MRRYSKEGSPINIIYGIEDMVKRCKDHQENQKIIQSRWMEKFNGLFERDLPKISDRRKWPITEADCFRRLAYDMACGCPWDTKYNSEKSEFKQMSHDEMNTVVDIVYAWIRGDRDLAQDYKQSIVWRQNCIRHY